MAVPELVEPAIGRLSYRDIARSALFRLRWSIRKAAAYRAIWIGTIVHLCIGNPYGWAAVGPLFAMRHGIVTKTEDEWPLDACLVVASYAFFTMDCFQGVNSKTIARIGPKNAITCGSLFIFLGYFMLAGAAWGDEFWKLQIGFLLVGFGMSFCYIPPVQNAIACHPDRPGLISGAVVGGFGAAPLLFGAMFERLLTVFKRMPKVGTQAQLDAWVARNGPPVEPKPSLLIPTLEDAALLPYPLPKLEEGQGYFPNSGDDGLGWTLMVIGLVYCAILALCARHLPEGKAKEEDGAPEEEEAGSFLECMKTKPFWILTYLKAVASVSITGLISTGKVICAQSFADRFPQVDSAFISRYVFFLVTGGLMGRIGWPALSDAIGPRRTFRVLTCTATAGFIGMPFLADAALQWESIPLLYGFLALTVLNVSIASGSFTSLVAYTGEIYGTKKIHEVYGRMSLMTCWAPIFGPMAVLHFRMLSVLKSKEPNAFLGHEYSFLAGLYGVCILLNEFTPRKDESEESMPIYDSPRVPAPKPSPLSLKHMELDGESVENNMFV